MNRSTITGRVVGLGRRARTYRWTLARRATQFGIWLLLFGTVHWGWSALGAPLVRGTLTASEVLGAVPLADPLAALQILLATHWLDREVILGALLVTGFYALVGGRSFCAWVCPINIITDSAAWLRRRLGLQDTLRISRRSRYWGLALALVLSGITGVAAFEWISPVAMTHRGAIFGLGGVWLVLLAIFIFDLLVLKDGWCGHLCPLGAFYGLLGRAGVIRVGFDAHACTRCGDCVRVCPEPQVLNLKALEQNGRVVGEACSNCGACIERCPEASLSFMISRRRGAVDPSASRVGGEDRRT